MLGALMTLTPRGKNGKAAHRCTIIGRYFTADVPNWLSPSRQLLGNDAAGHGRLTQLLSRGGRWCYPSSNRLRGSSRCCRFIIATDGDAADCGARRIYSATGEQRVRRLT